MMSNSSPFLTKNQINLILISISSVIFAALVGMLVVKKARDQWPYVVLYVLLFSGYITFFFKAFSL